MTYCQNTSSKIWKINIRNSQAHVNACHDVFILSSIFGIGSKIWEAFPHISSSYAYATWKRYHSTSFHASLLVHLRSSFGQMRTFASAQGTSLEDTPLFLNLLEEKIASHIGLKMCIKAFDKDSVDDFPRLDHGKLESEDSQTYPRRPPSSDSAYLATTSKDPNAITIDKKGEGNIQQSESPSDDADLYSVIHSPEYNDLDFDNPLRFKLIKLACHELMERFPHIHSIHLNSKQRNYFLKLLKCNEHNLARILVGQINKTLTNQLPQEISQEKKDRLREWMKSRDLDSRVQNQKEMKQIMNELGLSKTQLRQQMSFLLDESGELNNETKEIVIRWLEDHDYKSPTTSERNQLQSEAKISRTQLNNLIYRLQEPLGSVTQEKKDMIQKWLEDNDFKQPSSEEREYLQKLTALNKPQIFNLITILKRSKGVEKISLRENKKGREILKNWYKKNQRQPTLEERSQLEVETGFNWRQIYEQIRRWDDDIGKITPQARIQIFEALKLIDFDKPSSIVRDNLQQLTGLGRAQLNKQIENIRKKHANRIIEN